MTTQEIAAPAPAVGRELPGGEVAVLLSASAVSLLCLLHGGLSGRGVVGAFVGFVLVRLAAIDIRRRILPDRIVLPATAVTLVAQAALAPGRTPEWVLAALGSSLALFIPALLRPGALGLGDVKLALLLGAALGRGVVPALTVGLLAAGGFAALLLLVQGRVALKSTMPLGPFLALGGIVELLVR
ncbi:MAG TPA: A24 family peptidase [Gaiellaceae bacterium]|nr:A24 family peptidase [Gaiellaceae bacterium]